MSRTLTDASTTSKTIEDDLLDLDLSDSAWFKIPSAPKHPKQHKPIVEPLQSGVVDADWSNAYGGGNIQTLPELTKWQKIGAAPGGDMLIGMVSLFALETIPAIQSTARSANAVKEQRHICKPVGSRTECKESGVYS